MGFNLHINTILRIDSQDTLSEGDVRSFEKDSMHYLVDDMPIWLASKEWTALAEIKILNQSREDGKTTGSYEILHVYSGSEQVLASEMFKRMYGWT